MLSDITPLIMTRDEEANLARTLSMLTWAREVVVVDSMSTDGTETIARSFANVRFVRRSMDTIAAQWNHGLSLAATPWVLALDADHVVSHALVEELRTLEPSSAVAAYRARFVYMIHGRPLRASLYPPREVLLRRERCTFWQDGHTQRVRVEGAVGELHSTIAHDDRKPFPRFVERQRKYMRQEARKLRGGSPASLAGRLRKMIVVAPMAVLLHTLFVKRLILDGWPGLVYTFERVVAELILSRELLRRVESSDRPSPAGPSSS